MKSDDAARAGSLVETVDVLCHTRERLEASAPARQDLMGAVGRTGRDRPTAATHPTPTPAVGCLQRPPESPSSRVETRRHSPIRSTKRRDAARRRDSGSGEDRNPVMSCDLLAERRDRGI